MAMKSSTLVCCKLYISESRNASALDAIERAARLDPEAAIVNKFQDRAYNRIRATLLAMVEAAYAAVDLEEHLGAHPRLGVVDHICFHPLGDATLDDAARVAKLVASDIGDGLQVPVFLYEAAHPTLKPLDRIRRELGYYRPNFMGNQWAGWAIPETLPAIPDEGPTRVNRARGITMVGASRWVENYNVPVLSTDVPAARRIAQRVRARGGGLPTVQALALVHGDESTEIACMLLDPNRVGAELVQRQVEQLAAAEGLEAEKGYFTDYSQDMIVERYLRLVSD